MGYISNRQYIPEGAIHDFRPIFRSSMLVKHQINMAVNNRFLHDFRNFKINPLVYDPQKFPAGSSGLAKYRNFHIRDIILADCHDYKQGRSLQ